MSIDYEMFERHARLYHLSRSDRAQKRALVDMVLHNVGLAKQLNVLVPANPNDCIDPNYKEIGETVDYMAEELNKSIKEISGVDMLKLMKGKERINTMENMP